MHYISKSVHLCDPVADKNSLRLHYLRAMLIPGIAFIAVTVSFVMPSGSLLVYLIVPVVLYFFLRSGS
jgi:hypothetical protein